MYYIICNGEVLERFNTLAVAKIFAEAYHKQTNQHCTIEKREMVWSTQTIDEAMQEAAK